MGKRNEYVIVPGRKKKVKGKKRDSKKGGKK
jgi:hypothetical protein